MVRLHGYGSRPSSRKSQRDVFGNLVELTALAADGRVRMLTQTYPLDAANDAMDDLDSGRLRGREILIPADS